MSDFEKVSPIKIGYVVPTYNRPRLLERTVTSFARNAPMGDQCMIVVNDGSTEPYDIVALRKAYPGIVLDYTETLNRGALSARNTGIMRAMSLGCTHVGFLDDDDEFTPGAPSAIARRISENLTHGFYVFPSASSDCDRVVNWPTVPTLMDWRVDVLERRRLGSDQFIVLSLERIGSCRFSTIVRNQREWTLFACIARWNSSILVLPEVVQFVNYQPDGLSSVALNSPEMGLDQIFNTFHRALTYWTLHPLSSRFTFNLIRQLVLTPLRMVRLGLRSVKPNHAR